jgi:hypothetical protein
MEEVVRPGFDYRQHFELLCAVYDIDRERYIELSKLLRKTNRELASQMDTAVKHGASNVDEIFETQKFRHVFPDAPVPYETQVPRDWLVRDYSDVSDSVVIKVSQDGSRARGILGHPMVVSSVTTDKASGKVMLDISWQLHLGGRWKTKTIDKECFGSKSKAASIMAGWGTSVTANNIPGVLDWLTAYQGINTGIIPAKKSLSRLGWYEDEFVLPYETIRADNEEALVFAHANSDSAGVYSSVCQSGTMDGWTESIAHIAEYPLVVLGIYASLASAALHVLAPGEGNPVIDWAYRTSTGKTTTLRIASSVWGDDHLMVSWDGTVRGIVALAEAFSHIPLILDDTKKARTSRRGSYVTELLYALSGGSESVRSSPTGIRATSRFQTIVLSTGESKAIDLDKSGGTVARVLSLWGAPFGEENNTTAKRIELVIDGLARNHGFAGPALVEYMIRNKDKWPEWRDMMREKQRYVGKRMEGKVARGVSERHAKIVAVLHMTAELAHQCIPFPWVLPNVSDIIVDHLMSDDDESSQTDRAAEAMRLVLAQIAASPGRMSSGLTEYNQAAASVPLLGVYDDSNDDCYAALFRPSLLRELRVAGYGMRETMRTWKERGWIKKGQVDWLPGASKIEIITQKAVKEVNHD